MNDPTTAVQVLDHIGEVLDLVGRTDLDLRTNGSEPGATAAVVIVTRRWEDIVMLGLTEIREFGATSVQVMRRLRALLEELLATVRPEHRAASTRNSAVLTQPSPTAGGTPSTSTAHGTPIARASAVLRGPRRTSRRGSSPARAGRVGAARH